MFLCVTGTVYLALVSRYTVSDAVNVQMKTEPNRTPTDSDETGEKSGSGNRKSTASKARPIELEALWLEGGK